MNMCRRQMFADMLQQAEKSLLSVICIVNKNNVFLDFLQLTCQLLKFLIYYDQYTACCILFLLFPK